MYEDGTLNASSNCIDRHLKDKKDKTAIIWVGDDPKDSQKISYKQLHQKVSKAANGLKKLGIKKGDRVTIYITMTSYPTNISGAPINIFWFVVKNILMCH